MLLSEHTKDACIIYYSTSYTGFIKVRNLFVSSFFPIEAQRLFNFSNVESLWMDFLLYLVLRDSLEEQSEADSDDAGEDSEEGK